MKNVLVALCVLVGTFFVLIVPAHANLCRQVRDLKVDDDAKKEVRFYESLFKGKALHGNRTWNQILVACNRHRDLKGAKVRKMVTDDAYSHTRKRLKAKDLPQQVIGGKYNFLGKAVTMQRYRYALSKKKGVWKMVLLYKPVINDVVKDRIDISTSHSKKFYEANQVENKGTSDHPRHVLKEGAQSIWKTLCQSSTYFKGKEGKYDGKNGDNAHKRDRANKHISLGRIVYFHKTGKKDGEKKGRLKKGCRVMADTPLFYSGWAQTHSPLLDKVKPKVWVLENFIRVGESYWTIPGVFELRILLKGHNESEFSKNKKLKDKTK